MTSILRASATLAFFIPLRLASFIAQLFNAVQPLEWLGQYDVGCHWGQARDRI